MKTLSSLFLLTILSCCGFTALAQRSCGAVQQEKLILAAHPELSVLFSEHKKGLSAASEAGHTLIAEHTANKTTSCTTIPVIFHVILPAGKLAGIGGEAGVSARCISQIAALNEDFNRLNADSTYIPSGWRPLRGASGITFGLAHTDPNGRNTFGYELKVTSTPFYRGTYGDYSAAKYDTSDGLSAWDNSKYLNIWCIYFADLTGLLGVTTPQYITISGGGSIPNAEMGLALNFAAFGKRASPTDSFAGSHGEFCLGRTATHETGHFFGLMHTWGDDHGQCPWGGGSDDGIADTPPESDAHTGNPMATYSIIGGTSYDGCKINTTTGGNVQPYGVPSLDFLDYTDDSAMQMFTTDQAAAMANTIFPASSVYHSLTLNCPLLDWASGVTDIEQGASLKLFPNPSTGIVNGVFNEGTSSFQGAIITNTLGQVVQKVSAADVKNGTFSIDLGNCAKGIYFVTCNFAAGNISRKILLQ